LGGVPDYLWTPLAAGLLVLVCGVAGLATQQLWLFPSIGPTAFLLAHSPEAPSSQPWNVIVGHLVGLAGGYLALALLHGDAAPTVFALHALVPVCVWAGAFAVALTLAGQIATRSSHPPAAATTLLVALGGFRATVHDALAVIVGILIVAVAVESLRVVHARAG
jgi:CBS-domain-containing membrane protein